jgi:ankyrin repeat protein
MNDAVAAMHKTFEDAVMRDNAPVVRQMIQNGFDVNTRLNLPQWPEKTPNENESGLHLAALCGSTRVAQVLVDNRADVYMTTHVGYTAMHGAAMEGHLDVLRILLAAAPAAVNVVTHGGRTPLFDAAFYGQEHSIRLLIASGADEKLGAVDGVLPVDIALHRGHPHCAQLIEQETERRAALEVERVNRLIAVLMGLDPRLGSESHLRSLDTDLLLNILRNYTI